MEVARNCMANVVNSFRWALLHININNCSLSNVIMVYIVVQNLVEIDAVVSIT